MMMRRRTWIKRLQILKPWSNNGQRKQLHQFPYHHPPAAPPVIAAVVIVVVIVVT